MSYNAENKKKHGFRLWWPWNPPEPPKSKKRYMLLFACFMILWMGSLVFEILTQTGVIKGISFAAFGYFFPVHARYVIALMREKQTMHGASNSIVTIASILGSCFVFGGIIFSMVSFWNLLATPLA